MDQRRWREKETKDERKKKRERQEEKRERKKEEKWPFIPLVIIVCIE